MKPFNLEEALAGKPVQLRNGNKAYITADYINFFPFNIFRFQGVCLVENSQTQYERNQWTEDGFSLFKNDLYSINNNPYDIIGMYEEPTPTVTVTLPKPFKPKVGEYFYFITRQEDSYIICNNYYDGGNYFHRKAINSGVFRTKADAQAWLDAMKENIDE